MLITAFLVPFPDFVTSKRQAGSCQEVKLQSRHRIAMDSVTEWPFVSCQSQHSQSEGLVGAMSVVSAVAIVARA